MTLNEYLRIEPIDGAEGFTIGRGKKIYWYVTPMPGSGLYRCLPIEPDKRLGWPRYIDGSTEIQVVYIKNKKILYL